MHRRLTVRLTLTGWCLCGSHCSEGAGVVVKVGASVTSVAVGDRVVYSGSSGDDFAGSYAGYAAVPASVVVPLPAGVSFEEGW